MSFYQVYADDILIGDPTVDGLQLIDPEVLQEANAVATFTFTTQPDNKADIVPRKTIITAKSGAETIFRGIATEVSVDFFGQKKYYCEDELTYLNDTVQRPQVYTEATPRLMLEKILAEHNRQMPPEKQFTTGLVTVTSRNAVSTVANYATTLETIKAALTDAFGGYIRKRYEDGKNYIDYLHEPQYTSSQYISFGENLLDFTREKNASEIITALIPLGAKIEKEEPTEVEEYVTIAEANGGLDYITDPDGVARYGLIFGVAHFDDVTEAQQLKALGESYLAMGLAESLVIEVKALDLHLTDEQIEAFHCLDYVYIQSAPHDLSEHLIVTKLETNLADIQQNTLTLGASRYKSLTAKSNSDNSGIMQQLQALPTESEILDAAKRNATDLLTNAMGGYVYKTRNELYIMNTEDPATAKKVWRWNLNGLGYSDDGIDGPYGLAMTMDGAIVADFVSSGTLYGITFLQGSKTTLTDNNEGSYIGTDGFALGNKALVYEAASGMISIGNGAIMYNPAYNRVTFGNNVVLTWGSISDAPIIPDSTSDLINDSGYVDSGAVTYITQNAIQTGDLHLGGNIYRMVDGAYWWLSTNYLLFGVNSFNNLQVGSPSAEANYRNLNLYAQENMFFCPGGYPVGTESEGTSGWTMYVKNTYGDQGVSIRGTLSCSGTIHYTGAPQATSGSANVRLTNNTQNLCYLAESTRQIKEDIAPVADIDLAPEKLYNIDVVQFKYKPGILLEDDPRNGKMCIGLIAEQVFEAYPIAADMETGVPRNWDVRYLFPPLLKLVQEQHRQIEELRERIERMEAN